MDPATIAAIGTKVAEIITNAIKAGKSRKEAEREAAQALERGDIVNDELYEKLKGYVATTRDFEDSGA